MADLEPPPKATETEDSGAHELDTSEDEHFSDASEGKNSESSIPTTRVEKVDDEPSHGEVPGTAAYEMRTQDAQPDEVEVISESEESPSVPPIPMTVVEKVDPEEKSHGEVEGTTAHDLRKADAEPDVVTQAPEVSRTDLEALADPPEVEHAVDEDDHLTPTQSQQGSVKGDDNGDDDSDDDDFGAFDENEGMEEEADEADSRASATRTPSSPPVPLEELLPLLKLDDLGSPEEMMRATDIYMKDLFPGFDKEAIAEKEALPDISPSFLTERSQSLWEQLVAPPPLQPPDWVRSRIRRLFLVSLGVPVDLDEIMPPSRQKKLVLPSMELESANRRSRTESSRGTTAADRLKVDGANQDASRSSSRSKDDRRRRGQTPSPPFDLNAARIICSTTDMALAGYTEDELRAHVTLLDEMKYQASRLLEHHLVRLDSSRGEKEVLEQVVENMVKHAKGIRGKPRK